MTESILERIKEVTEAPEFKDCEGVRMIKQIIESNDHLNFKKIS